METDKSTWLDRVLGRAGEGAKSKVARAQAVDAKEHSGEGLRLGERTRRARRKVAPSLFDNCEMVKVQSFEVRSETGRFRARYEIRQTADGKGRKLVCLEIFDCGTPDPLAEGCETHPDEHTLHSFDGMDFRAIATLAGQTYLVVRKPPTVAPVRNGVESYNLWPVATPV